MTRQQVRRRVVVALTCLVAVNAVSAATPIPKAAVYVCGDEQKTFDRFKARMAEFDPDYKPPAGIETVSHTTSDGKTLVGYMAKARDGAHFRATPLGYILFLPGNAVYAQDVVSDIADLAQLGYDVYVYDYRGYGRSSGPSSVSGIISDAKELIAMLNRPAGEGGRGYAASVIYGISAGAAVAVNALDSSSHFDRLILDGIPATMSVRLRIFFDWSRVTILDCPANLAPMNRPLPYAKRSLLIAGEQDPILRNTQYQRDQNRLLEKAKAAGICVSVQPKFGHPLMDGWTRTRMEMIGKFLKADVSGGCPSLPTY